MRIIACFSVCASLAGCSPSVREAGAGVVSRRDVDAPLATDWEQRVPPAAERPQAKWTRYGPRIDWIAANGGGHDGYRWVTHPPLAFARDLLGDERMDQCVAALQHDTDHCSVRVECGWLVVAQTGNVQLDIDASCLRNETFMQADVELVSEEGETLARIPPVAALP